MKTGQAHAASLLQVTIGVVRPERSMVWTLCKVRLMRRRYARDRRNDSADAPSGRRHQPNSGSSRTGVDGVSWGNAVLSNEEVLSLLRRVHYRQIPWHKRSRTMTAFRTLGLVAIERVPSRINAREPEPVDIAVLTPLGQGELARQERMAAGTHWLRAARLNYDASSGTGHLTDPKTAIPNLRI
jgi:hypothetical protein